MSSAGSSQLKGQSKPAAETSFALVMVMAVDEVGGRVQLPWQAQLGRSLPRIPVYALLGWSLRSHLVGTQGVPDTGTHKLPSGADVGREEVQRPSCPSDSW